jgi:hypothetical protein
MVTLLRDPTVMIQEPTWSVGSVMSNADAQFIRDTLKGHVDAFLNAWHSVNPKRSPSQNYFRNFDRSLSPFAFGSPRFDGSNADYGNPFDYGYPSDDSQRYDSSNAGYQSSVSAVIEVQLEAWLKALVILIKRQMYGRAGFHLLRARVLPYHAMAP